MMKDLFVDIEALGRVRGCAIIQLGAIVFDPWTGETDSEIQLYIQPEARDPWHVDLDTLQWHSQQGTFPHPADIREKLALPAGDAIDAFAEWLGEVALDHEIDDVWAWGNTYDIPILDPYWERYGNAIPPWAYWQPSDARTIWKLAFPGKKHDPRPHHALDDCKAGVKDLHAALMALTRRDVG